MYARPQTGPDCHGSPDVLALGITLCSIYDANYLHIYRTGLKSCRQYCVGLQSESNNDSDIYPAYILSLKGVGARFNTWNEH